MAGEGPIETAYVEIKPKISPDFAKQVRQAIGPELKRLGKEASAAFNQIEESSRAASLGIRSVTRSLNSASKAAQQFGAAAARDAGSVRGLGAAASAASRETTRGMAGASKSLKNLSKEADNSAKHFTTLRYTIRSAFRTAAFAAAGGIAAIGAFGVKAAADLEQVKIAFQGLLGSAPAADDFIARLQKFAARTPFDFADVAKGSQKLIALGQTGSQAIATLTTVGNAAAAVGASGDAINRVVLAISQIQAKGKLSAEELNQIAEALPNFNRAQVIQNLADAFGVSTTEIQKFQQKGMIPAKAGIDAVLKSLQQVPGAMGAMDRQADTLIGKFSTFKDTIKADFSNALVDSLPIIGNALDSLTGTIDKQLQSFAPALGQFVAGLGPVVESLVNSLGPVLTSLLQSITPLLQELAPSLVPLGQVIASIFSVLGPALVPLAQGISTIVTALGTGLVPIFTSLQPLLNAIGSGIGQIFTALAPIITQLLTSLQPLIAALSGALAPIVSTLAQAIVQLAPSLVPLADAFNQVIVALLPLIPTLLQLVNDVLPLLIFSINFFVAKRIFALIIALKLAAFVINKVLAPALRFIETVIRVVVVPAIKWLLNTAVSAFAGLAHAAASAFGWVPGLGGKLKDAASAVDRFKDTVNASLDKITTDVVINVTTVFTEGTPAQAKARATRSALIASALSDASGGHPNTLTPQDRRDIIAEVDARIAAEVRANAAARKKANLPPAGGGPTPDLLPDSRSNAAKSGKSAAQKAADAAKKAARDVAQAVLEAAKRMADGLKVKLSNATDRLKKIRDQFNQIRDAIADAFRAQNLFDSRNARQFLKRAGRNIVQNTSVLKSEKILQSRLGGSAGGPEFLKQLFESGNVRLIKNLAAQSSSTLADVLAKFNADNALANKIGSAVASATLVGGKPILVVLKSTEAEIIKLRHALVLALAKVEAATRARARLKAAAGGIFTAGTDLEVGEAGREVVVPMARPARALELLLKSGAFALPTVAAHLDRQANAEAKITLKDLGVPTTTIGYGRTATGPRPPAPPMALKVVKERVLNQEIHVHEVGNGQVTADRIYARTAAHMDR